jgi:bifunctional ADP-heptose synthase (sugar kinase/adenylyltransferase)
MASQQPQLSSEDRKRLHDEAMERCHKNVEAAKADNSGRVYRVYADGIFDMAHVGHFKMLEQVNRPRNAEPCCKILMASDIVFSK